MNRAAQPPTVQPFLLLEAAMELTDILIATLIVGAFATFMSVLGWAAHIDYKSPRRDQPAPGE